MIEEQRFLNEISGQLDRFTKKKRGLWNLRCPFCGDSKKDRKKARGYIYEHNGRLKYKCHNCGENLTFHQFLKKLDENVYREYLFEKFGNQKSESPEPEYDYDVSEKIKKVSDARAYTRYLEGPISELEPEHEAKKFVNERMIPEKYWSDLYYTDNYKRFINKIASTEDQFKYNNGGPRVIIPFYDEDCNLIALQGRALGGQSIKYLTYKLAEGNPKIFGLDSVDKSKRVKIVEGPIDSMFLDNAIAAAGSDLKDVGISDYVLVFDNEPRNREIVKKIDRSVKNNEPIFISPNHIKEKDINDLVLSGWKKEQIEKLINDNTYKGLKARVAFNKWKRI